MRILDLSGKAAEQFPDAEIIQELDGQPVDLILAGLALCNTASHEEFLPTLQAWTDALAERGELHIQVPSMEWAAREILGERLHIGLWTHIYQQGGMVRGFTMEALRGILGSLGMRVGFTKTVPYVVMRSQDGGPDYLGEMHYVVGLKGPLREWLS